MRLARLETLAWNFGPFAAPFPFNSAHTLKHAEDENSELDKTLLKLSGNRTFKIPPVIKHHDEPDYTYAIYLHFPSICLRWPILLLQTESSI
jgi:hypothetical protein